MNFLRRDRNEKISIVVLVDFTNAMPLSKVQGAVAHTQAEAVAWANAQIGRSLDYDGQYGAQCVDLTAFYYSYLGTHTPGGNAIDYATNVLPVGWERRTANFQSGDIAVWYANRGGTTSLEHVTIIISTDVIMRLIKMAIIVKVITQQTNIQYPIFSA